MLQETFREQDVIGRIGGVELAILAVGLVDTEREQAPAKLRDNVMRRTKEYSANIPVSLSIAVAECDSGKPFDLEALMARADQSPSRLSFRVF